VFPSYEETIYRVEYWGDEVERILQMNPVTGEVIDEISELWVYPASHYVTSRSRMEAALVEIEHELAERLGSLEHEGKHLEAQRLRMRTAYDMEMMREVGFCSGIENYSRYLDGREAGEAPFTLLDYFPDDYLTVIDESHVTIPQIHGQHAGDRSRKDVLVEHGFRLPSAIDNRPLTFEEWYAKTSQAILLSATPGDWERRESAAVVEQIIRPTGLVDPEVIVRPTKGQIDDLVGEVKERAANDQRVLVTTLTKKMAEDLADYLLEMGLRARYLHSDIDTLERVQILRDLRVGEYDVLVGINLLREGLDLPEVSLVAILDADKEGFLRSETSLVQTIGRASRNVDGAVVMYADEITNSMRRALDETNRRRASQLAYNEEHDIDPQTIRKKVSDILELIQTSDAPAADRRARELRRKEPLDLTEPDLRRLIQSLEEEMHESASDLRFEYAARLRDEINELKRELRDLAEAAR
jgi:excinuclease ABC subunit B